MLGRLSQYVHKNLPSFRPIICLKQFSFVIYRILLRTLHKLSKLVAMPKSQLRRKRIRAARVEAEPISHAEVTDDSFAGRGKRSKVGKDKDTNGDTKDKTLLPILQKVSKLAFFSMTSTEFKI